VANLPRHTHSAAALASKSHITVPAMPPLNSEEKGNRSASRVCGKLAPMACADVACRGLPPPSAPRELRCAVCAAPGGF